MFFFFRIMDFDGEKLSLSQLQTYNPKEKSTCWRLFEGFQGDYCEC